MDRYTLNLLLVTLLSILCNDSYAVKYTAYKSGNFSDPGIWQGGVVPPAHIGANEVHISAFISVNMDSSLYIDSWSSILVIGEGAKLSSATNFIEYTAGDIGGNKGTIDIDSMYIRTSTGFAGTLILNKLNMSDGGFHDTAKISINQVLHMPDDKAEFYKCKVQLAKAKPYTTFILEGGHLEIDTLKKDFDLTQPYNILVTDTTSYYLPELELSAPNIQDFTLDSRSSDINYGIGLKVDLTVHGKMKLIKGWLGAHYLDSVYVTLTDSATIESDSGNLTVNGLIVRSAKQKVGYIRTFSVHHLIMDTPSPNCVLETDFSEVNKKIELLSGKILIRNWFRLGEGIHYKNVEVVGGSQDSYIITNDTNYVFIYNDTSDLFYPIGTMKYYSPVTYSCGGIRTEIRGSVYEGVYDKTRISNAATTQPVVNLTWQAYVNHGNSLIQTVTPTWHKDLEVNGFNRSNAYVSLNYDSAKNNAVTGNGNYFTTTRNYNGPPALYFFSVVDANARLSVSDIDGSKSRINIYPNPATNTLHIEGVEANTTVVIYNVQGQVVSSTQLSDDKIDVSALPAGVYYLHLKGERTNATAKFIKE